MLENPNARDGDAPILIRIPRNALVMPVGPAASGKSSFGQAFFPFFRHVSSDMCRAMVSDDPTNQDCNELAFALFHQWIESRLKFGKLVYADATNLTPKARKVLHTVSATYGAPVIALQFHTPQELCLLRNSQRDRHVPEHVIEKHCMQMQQAVQELPKEGFTAIYDIYPDAYYNIEVEELPRRVTAPGFDIIGDVHSCAEELLELLDKLGYTGGRNPDGSLAPVHPEGRQLIFVGDIIDRGPDPIRTLRIWRDALLGGHAAVMGNHDNKLLRALAGNQVRMSHGLAETYRAMREFLGEDERWEYRKLLAALPYQLRLTVEGHPDVFVCHAGMPKDMVGRDDKAARAHCLYGEVTGHDENGYPKRGDSWELSWTPGDDDPILIHGHTVTESIYSSQWANVLNLDTGCVFGGKLTAYRYPEHELVQVDAKQTYAEHH